MRSACMRIFIALLSLFSALSSTASAEQRAYRLDRPSAALQFSVQQFGMTVHGAFTEFDATLAFDNDKPQDADLNVEIQTASVRAGMSTAGMRHAFDAG